MACVVVGWLGVWVLGGGSWCWLVGWFGRLIGVVLLVFGELF